MGSESRITQADLARKLRLSQATISRALSGSPLLPPKTIQQVQAQAEALGYRPDPMLFRLSSYRKSKRPLTTGQCLAWITHLPQAQLESDNYHGPLFRGAMKRAAELGYRLETFWSHEPGLNVTSILKFLSYRNVEGLLFPPQPKPLAHLHIPLEHFSAIAVGHSLYSPKLDQVAHSHFHSMVMVYRKLLTLGYKRIGLVLTPQSDGRTAGLWRGAYYLQQSLKVNATAIPILQSPENDLRCLRSWLRRWKPDAVIIHFERRGSRIEQLAELGLSYPNDIGVALLSLPKGYEHFSGIDELTEQLGTFAVDTLVAKIRNHQRGLPAVRSLHQLEGRWHDGDSLRRQTSGRERAK